MSEIKRIEDQLQRAFEGNAWHGPAVRELIADVTAAQASGKPLPNVHSIWEIALHMATWERVVHRRLQGETVVDLPTEQDWPPVRDASETAWRQAVRDLELANHDLRAAIAQSTEAHLTDMAPGKDHSVYVMLHGVIQHDLYHAGQIAILKKAQS